MERIAFLIEPSGRRISCLLNPQDVTVRRMAGVRPRRSVGGAIAGRGLSDEPLVFTGGGRTEIELELLFDVTLAGSSEPSMDVRELTRPIWELAENAAEGGTYGRPPTMRMLWGKRWNVPAVVTAVSERFERFAADGAPGRSWMRLALVRVPEPPPQPPTSAFAAEHREWPDVLEGVPELEFDEELFHEVVGSSGTAEDESAAVPEVPEGERLDEIAWRYLGHPAGWKFLAELNDLVDPLRLSLGSRLRVRPHADQDEDEP